METATGQLYTFLVFSLSGIVIGIFFDVFRILRKSFKTPDFITYIEDVVFWITTGCFILFLLYYFNNGEIRWYTFLGIFIGIILYILFISKYFIAINLNIIFFPFKWIIRKLILKPISFIVINFKKTFQTFFAKNKNKFQKNSKKKKDFDIECRKI